MNAQKLRIFFENLHAERLGPVPYSVIAAGLVVALLFVGVGMQKSPAPTPVFQAPIAATGPTSKHEPRRADKADITQVSPTTDLTDPRSRVGIMVAFKLKNPLGAVSKASTGVSTGASGPAGAGGGASDGTGGAPSGCKTISETKSKVVIECVDDQGATIRCTGTASRLVCTRKKGGKEKTETTTFTYVVDVTYDDKDYNSFESARGLPTDTDPLILYVGTNTSGTRAKFLVSDGITVQGATVDEDLGTIDLAEGDEVILTQLDESVHRLTLNAIKKKT